MTYSTTHTFTAKAGREDELFEFFQNVSRGMSGYEGCLKYEVGRGEHGESVVSEEWTSAEAHAASLKDPAVLEAVATGRELIDLIQ